MASFGHSGSHTSQLMHSSVIIKAMIFSFNSLKIFSNFSDQPFANRWLHELAHVTTENSDLADHRRRNEHVLLTRRQEQGFYFRVEIAVHPRHLEFVFKIRRRTQTAQNYLGALLVQEIHQQAVKTAYLGIRVRHQNLSGHLDAFFKSEKRALGVAGGNRDDHMIEKIDRPANEVFVPARHRVKSSC